VGRCRFLLTMVVALPTRFDGSIRPSVGAHFHGLPDGEIRWTCALPGKTTVLTFSCISRLAKCTRSMIGMVAHKRFRPSWNLAGRIEEATRGSGKPGSQIQRRLAGR